MFQIVVVQALNTYVTDILFSGGNPECPKQLNDAHDCPSVFSFLADDLFCALLVFVSDDLVEDPLIEIDHSFSHDLCPFFIFPNNLDRPVPLAVYLQQSLVVELKRRKVTINSNLVYICLSKFFVRFLA